MCQLKHIWVEFIFFHRKVASAVIFNQLCTFLDGWPGVNVVIISWEVANEESWPTSMILTLINMTFKLLSIYCRHQQNHRKNLIILCCSVENGSFDACLLRLEMSSVNIENWSFIARNRKSEIARNQKNVSSLETPSKVRCDASQSILRHL